MTCQLPIKLSLDTWPSHTRQSHVANSTCTTTIGHNNVEEHVNLNTLLSITVTKNPSTLSAFHNLQTKINSHSIEIEVQNKNKKTQTQNTFLYL